MHCSVAQLFWGPCTPVDISPVNSLILQAGLTKLFLAPYLEEQALFMFPKEKLQLCIC